MESSPEFVLDFSSIFALFRVSEGHDLTADGKLFIISQHLKDYLVSEEAECRIRRRSEIAVTITREYVDSNLTDQEQLDQHSLYYQQLLTCVDKYCLTDFDPAILNIIPKLKDGLSEIDFHQRTLVDTIQLAKRTERLLVSDDSIHFRANSPVKAISLEHFLAKYHNSNYPGKYVFELIHLNYRGLTLQSLHLMRCFMQDQHPDDSRGDFQLALNSFSVVHNPVGANLWHVLKFIRELYDLEHELEFKRRISLIVMRRFLSNLVITDEVLEFITGNINALFATIPEEIVQLRENILIILIELAGNESVSEVP